MVKSSWKLLFRSLSRAPRQSIQALPTTSSEGRAVRKVFHPFVCRLTFAKGFDLNSPQSLVGAGFASLAMAVLTTFRWTPFILYMLSTYIDHKDSSIHLFIYACEYLVLIWMGLLMVVFILLGGILLFSKKIQSTAMLMLHPWGLLLLYGDVFIWATMCVYLYMEINFSRKGEVIYAQLKYPLAYLTIAFVDTCLFCCIYFFYATYFIIVELTVIEKFYWNREDKLARQSSNI